MTDAPRLLNATRRVTLAILLFAGWTGISVGVELSNQLSPAEVQAGWKLLWDGRTTAGWTGIHSDSFPAKGWTIREGVLTISKSGQHPGLGGGDIITTGVYSNFELSVDFRLTAGANSGIKYFVDPAKGNGVNGNGLGFEYQILDDQRHPDAKLGVGGNRTLGSLYDLIAPALDKPVRPVGEWNTALIVVRGKQGEHWLNGRKILEYDRSSPEFHVAMKRSKFMKFPGFFDRSNGHLLLQEHDGEVAYRNIKIRVLPGPQAP